MPTDTAVAVLSKSYDATEETDNKAAEDFLTCKLGHKPNRQDEQKDLSDLAANIGKADNSGWKGIEHYSTSYIQQLHRCAERVGNNPSAQEWADKEIDAIKTIPQAVQAAAFEILFRVRNGSYITDSVMRCGRRDNSVAPVKNTEKLSRQ
jgi:hypothetical protein